MTKDPDTAGAERRAPDEMAGYALEALGRLRELAADPETPDKLRTDIDKWFVETWFGKGPLCRQPSPGEESGALTLRFEGELEDWAG